MECVSNCSIISGYGYYDMPEKVCMNNCKT